MVDFLGKLTKGAEMAAHQLVLVCNRVTELQAANKAAMRRKSHKRKRIQEEETLTINDSA
jgi:hypothetical protein